MTIPDPDLLTPSQVARIFHVNPRTVTRWVKAGKIPGIWTPGGQRRLRRADVVAWLNSPEAKGN